MKFPAGTQANSIPSTEDLNFVPDEHITASAGMEAVVALLGKGVSVWVDSIVFEGSILRSWTNDYCCLSMGWRR
jgi:hypothetical protein